MNRQRRRWIEQSLAALCTVVVLGWVFSRVDLGRVSTALGHADPATLVAIAVFATLVNTLESAEGFRRALAVHGARVGYVAALKATVGNLAIFSAMPAGSGNLGRVLYLNRHHDVALGRGVAASATLLWLKLCTLFALSVLGASLTGSTELLRIAAPGLALSLALGMMASRLARLWLTRRGTRGHALASALAEPSKPDALALALATVHAFILVLAEAAVFVWLLRAFGQSVPLAVVLARFPLVVIGSKVPITLMGLGTREALAVWLFSGWGPPESLLATTLSLSAVEQLLPAALGSLFAIPFIVGLIRGQTRNRAH
jgi:uncharacterized membrane protein YbhN (UPF0104 family)